MKPSCNKVKNPCKICLQQVTNKNGLQCQGACKKWAHFKCLNYTPGKISDIKAGLIKVTCPCPDCDTTQPKEFLTNPPFTCSNNQCPANTVPKCQSDECPSNKNNPQKQQQQQQQQQEGKRQQKGGDFGECPNKECSNEAIRCPAVECPNAEYPGQQKKSHPRMAPPRPPTPPRATSQRQKSPPKHSGVGGACRNAPKNKCFEESKDKGKGNRSAGKKTCPSECEKEKDRTKKNLPQIQPARSRSSSMISSDQSGCACGGQKSPSSPPSSPKNKRGGGGGGTCGGTANKNKCFEESKNKKEIAKKQGCPNECEESREKDKKGKDKKKKQPPSRSRSSSMLSSDQSAYFAEKVPAVSSSDSKVSSDPRRRASMMHALQDMCQTCGKLSIQLKELMCKMMTTMQ